LQNLPHAILIHPKQESGTMPQKGPEKQVPEDQRARGMNPEHPEGQANEKNREKQAGGGKAPPPGGKP